MEPQQAPNDGLRSQVRCDVAPVEVAASFHRFGDLPVELQLDIWDHVFPPLARHPSVLCFKLTVCRNSKGLVACFSPDEHVASSTLPHRALLATCHLTRQKALESLNIATLFRFDESRGTATEFRIPFDFDNTCFCIEGWEGHGIDAAGYRNINGMDFARRVKCLALVVQDGHTKVDRNTYIFANRPPLQEASHLALRFHNATRVGAIPTSISRVRDSVTEEVFASLFSFQPFAQKEMVEGFLLTKEFYERLRSLRDILDSVFGDWEQRLQAAVPGWTRAPPN